MKTTVPIGAARCGALSAVATSVRPHVLRRFSSSLGIGLHLCAGLVQRLLALLDEFLTTLNRTVHRFGAAIDVFSEFIFGAGGIVAKKPAYLRSGLWGEKQRDTRPFLP